MVQFSIEKMSLQRQATFFFAGFIFVTFITIVYFNTECGYYYVQSALAISHSLFSRLTNTPGKKLSFNHLQPLRKMFTNFGKNQSHSHVRLKNSCMSMEPSNLSDLEELKKKENVLLLVIVSTAPFRQERRAAIRETWWSKCHGKIECKFFTDGLKMSEVQKRQLSEEKRIHNDIEFQPIVGGRTFGLRYLYHIMWATAKYNFSYLLRVDDDYFVCIERLVHELHHRPRKLLKWGWYHCMFPDLIYADEAWTLFSYDVIERFLLQDPHHIPCHPHADQQIPIWISNVYNRSDILIHFDDRRLHHLPSAKSVTQVCDYFMGVHRSTPEMLRTFWRNSSDTAKEVTPLTYISQTCDKPNIFNISLMGKPYKFELRPCIENPQWTPEEQVWLGIQSGGGKLTSLC